MSNRKIASCIKGLPLLNLMRKVWLCCIHQSNADNKFISTNAGKGQAPWNDKHRQSGRKRTESRTGHAQKHSQWIRAERWTRHTHKQDEPLPVTNESLLSLLFLSHSFHSHQEQFLHLMFWFSIIGSHDLNIFSIWGWQNYCKKKKKKGFYTNLFSLYNHIIMICHG